MPRTEYACANQTHIGSRIFKAGEVIATLEIPDGIDVAPVLRAIVSGRAMPVTPSLVGETAAQTITESEPLKAS